MDAAFIDPERPASIVRPAKLSHGTLTCQDLDRSRRFYEEFLGLECVRHQKVAMVVSHGREWAIVCLQMGDKAQGRSALHHWGIDVASMDEVDRAHAAAVEHQARYGLQRVMGVSNQHGTYGFYMQDCDGNWWEIQYVGDHDYQTLFDNGDIDLVAEAAAR